MRRLSAMLLPAAVAAATALVLVPGAQGADGYDFHGVRLIAVRAAGHADREWLRLRNETDSTRRIPAKKVSPYQLRMSAGRIRTVQLDDTAITVKAGQTITLRFRCATHAKRPKQVGTVVYLCLDRGRGELSQLDVLADAGAVVTLSSDGTGLTRLGYGSQRSASAY